MGELYPKGNFKTGGKSLLSKRYNTPHRTHIIKTRVTEEEHADFMERLTAYGMSQSEFIRQAITGATVKPIIIVSPVNDELLAAVGRLTGEYGKIGGNLNQIARYLNEYGAPYNTLAAEVRAELSDLAALKFQVLREVGEAIGNTETFKYLTFEHDEFTGKPILDENGRLVPRQDYRISSLNCGEEDFAVACMRANLRYGKNQQREDVKSHHYILSFDPRDGPDHGLTMDKAQALGERFCAEQFPGHQALVCTHPDGHNHSGNIHVHIVINSLRVAEVERKPYMDRASDTQAGAKHRCTAAAMRHFRAEVMELCQGAGLYQIDLLGGSKNRVTEREYWAQKKGQLALDTEAAAQGKPPTKFETDKEKLRREIRAVLNLAVSFEDFAQRLLQRGITVKESRGRLSYLTPDRAKPITARKLGDDFDRAAVGAALERNAARPSLGAKPSIREQLRQPQGVQRMVDIEAKKAEGKGIGYQQWASVFNLKQIANSVNVYTEYGFSSPEELDAAVSAAFAAVRDSAASLKPKELALKEKKELRRQIIIYRNTKAVRDGLAAQKTPKARAAYRQEHEGDLLLSEATIRFFKANGITKLPTVKELTAEIEALMSEKNAGYNEYQERKREADELLTVKRNIDQVLHGAPSQRRDEHDR